MPAAALLAALVVGYVAALAPMAAADATFVHSESGHLDLPRATWSGCATMGLGGPADHCWVGMADAAGEGITYNIHSVPEEANYFVLNGKPVVGGQTAYSINVCYIDSLGFEFDCQGGAGDPWGWIPPVVEEMIVFLGPVSKPADYTVSFFHVDR